MKKILFLLLFISLKMFGQSITIVPNNSGFFAEALKIKKTGGGLEHQSTDGLVGIGTWVNPNYAFLRTTTNNNLSFGTNNGGSQMTLTTSGRLGVGVNLLPTATLDVERGTATDGTALFRGTQWISHFNYATTEDTYIRGGKNGSKVLINDLSGLGNVGIGITNPLAKLHLSQGNLRIDNLGGSGNVQLYADNLGTISVTLPVAFSVKSNQNAIPIANATSIIFPFNTENYDEGSFFNNTTFEFSAPLNGIYHFDCAVTFGVVNSAFSTSGYEMTILVEGGVGGGINKQDLKVGGEKTLSLSQDIKLNAGQKVKLNLWQNSGNTINLIGQSLSFFSGHLVTRL